MKTLKEAGGAFEATLQLLNAAGYAVITRSKLKVLEAKAKSGDELRKYCISIPEFDPSGPSKEWQSGFKTALHKVLEIITKNERK